MTAKDYREASEIASRLRELSGSDLAAGLDSECGSSSALRARVELLIQADRAAAAGNFLGERAIDDVAALMTALPPVALLPGTVFGNYRLGAKLGAGGMGLIYEGEDLRLHRRVAIKILPPSIAGGNTEAVMRFEREARAVSLLNHPNIVSIYDAGFDQGHYYIAMEFVEGKTLRRLLADEPAAVDFKTVIEITGQVALALAAAHDAGIVHRDIKPENIMLRPDGIVKVLDFGLARLRKAPSEASGGGSNLQTRPGNLAGTIQYLSPEQVMGKAACPRSDLFSLGVVTYELATGVRPFDGMTDGAIFDAILNRDPEPASRARPGLGTALDSLLQQALEKDPDFRFQTARDLRSGLLRTSRDSNGHHLAAPPGFRWRMGTRGKFWTAAGAAALVTAALVWTFAPARRSMTNAPLPTEFQQLTDTPGEENSPSFSPDGRQFIFASTRDGNWDIYLQRVGGSTAVNLTRDCRQNDIQPSFSPDGSKIAFRSERDGGGLFVMEPTGENPRRISPRGYFPAWSPDSRHLVYSTHTFTSPQALTAPPASLYVVDTDNGEERELKTGDATQPNWSPHGVRIAYFGMSDGGRRDIFTVAADGRNAPLAVTADAPLDWNPVWAPAGDQLYFLSDRGGKMNIWRIPIDESSGRTLGPPEPVTVASAYVDSLAIASNGKALIYSEASQRTNLGWIAFDPIRRVVVGSPAPVADGQAVAEFTFSPDGSQIVYDTLGDTSEELWIMNADGTGRRRLTSDTHRNLSPQWSPKGDQILFYSDRSAQYENWAVHPDGSGLRALTKNSNPEMQSGAWSPDEKHILAGRFGTTLELDLPAIGTNAYSKELAGLRNMFCNQWTAGPDGEQAICDQWRGAGGSEIVVYTPSTGKLEHTGVSGLFSTWISKSSHRYFLFERGSACFLYDRVQKRETRLFSREAANRFYSVAVTPDGKKIYFSERIRDSNLWLAKFGS